MWTNQPSRRSSVSAILIGAGILLALSAGFAAGVKPQFLWLAIVAVPAVVCLFAYFEQAVLGLLILRTCLDPFSAQQIPAAFAVAVDVLTLLYVTVMLFKGRRVHTDAFWWFFAGWVMLQGLWVILLPLGGVGLDASLMPIAIREWIRLFSWVMIYLLVMQLKERLSPQKVISRLYLALVAPIIVAFMQMFIPSHLPAFLWGTGGEGSIQSEVSRIQGTFGHPNGFATTLLLFISLTCWKVTQSPHRIRWLVFLGLLGFCFVATKALTGLTMFAAFVLAFMAPRLRPVTLFGGVLFLAFIILVFASSDFGRDRLGSLANTPLLNPDMDISRAILLSRGDNNSFNWRLAQWDLLLNGAFPKSPVLGFGLGLSIQASGTTYLPHNDYVRALIEGGIVGFVTYITFLMAQAVRLVQLIQSAPVGCAQRNLCSILLAVLFAILTGMLSDNIWSHTTLFFYWFTMLAIAGWDWNNPLSQKYSGVTKGTYL